MLIFLKDRTGFSGSVLYFCKYIRIDIRTGNTLYRMRNILSAIICQIHNPIHYAMILFLYIFIQMKMSKKPVFKI